jgi:4-amino-4-deoxy-L-arabinose transferase-like glycosyltransferase
MFQPGLLDDADSVHAEAAREMVLRHDWVTLYINGFRYLEKAPLMYWSIAASFKAFGVAEWSARLPLVLGVLALMGCVFALGRRFYGDEGGFYAALIIATAPGIYLYTRFLIPDTWVGLWLAAGFYFFLVGYEQRTPSRWACWGLGASAALNVLTKGLIGLAFTGLIILLFLLALNDFGYLKKMRLFSSAIVFLLIAAPWHILAAVRNPAQPSGPEKGFLWEYFVNEHLLRYLNERIPRDYDKVPLLLFWVLTFVWLIPWAAFLFPAFKQIPFQLRALRENLDARGRANLLMAIWAIVIIGFFTLSSRQEYYTVPVLPALALLAGGWLERESSAAPGNVTKRSGRRIASVLFCIGIVCFVITETLFFLSKEVPAGTQISDVLVEQPANYKLSLGHVSDLTLQSFGIFHTPLWEIGAVILLGTGFGWWFRKRGSPYKGNLAIGVMMVGVLFCVHQAFVTFSPELSSKPLAMAIAQRYEPGQIIVLNGEYAWGSTLNFYTGVPLHMLNSKRNNLWFGSLFPDSPQIFETSESFVQLWNGKERVYLFTREFNKQQAVVNLDPQTVYVLAREGNKVVLTNKPL